MINLQHFLLLLQVASITSQGPCGGVLNACKKSTPAWQRCYEENITLCISGRSGTGPIEGVFDFFKTDVDTNTDFEHVTEAGYALYLPPEALRRSTRLRSLDGSTTMALTLFNSSLFMVDVGENETILGGKVLSVKVGKLAVRDLSQPVRISFTHANETGGRCVYYEVLDDANGTGRWSTEGCVVSRTNTTFVCSCSHLSFFAVLVNTEVSIDPANALTLSYISYIGCGLSVFFTTLTILMHLCLRKGRTDHSMAVHLNLTGALFFLHLFFLVSALWAGPGLGLGADGGGVACQALGLLLHYALLATFTWMAIESFHLYMLLVRVFNIYVAKYLLKLGLVGWGVPMVTVIACALNQTYGRFSLQRERNRGASTGTEAEVKADMCWIRRKDVSYITVTGYLGLVFLFGAVMLGVMVAKLRRMRTKSAAYQEHKRRLWRDCLTLLGMGCILGIPWGLAFVTYGPLSLPGLYLFTILNGLQGVFMFLWFLATTWQPCKDSSSEANDPSTQKMETSFNN
ncbi:adhesion G protein-coupled receptor G3-like [Anguilla anguilla]|uniref:adhesion G protein-coupled receptor G3-like n=1 Tax=Anguilla anguilla TaxID=7936 RepID=UPI0015A9BD1B|nr:adhesion G protein-coupled receptor G3-like [Anguilla anguilla]